MNLEAWTTPRRVGFVSTRIAGLDGVSLEIDKWARIIERHGCKCFYIAGELDRPPERCHRIDEAHFAHPNIKQIHDEIFGQRRRPRALSDHIYATSRRLKQQLYDAIETLDLDLIIAENCLTIPLNIPLGIALVELPASEGAPQARYRGKPVMVKRDADAWVAVVGIPLGAKPGRKPAGGGGRPRPGGASRGPSRPALLQRLKAPGHAARVVSCGA